MLWCARTLTSFSWSNYYLLSARSIRLARVKMNEIQWKYYSRLAHNERISILSFVHCNGSFVLSWTILWTRSNSMQIRENCFRCSPLEWRISARVSSSVSEFIRKPWTIVELLSSDLKKERKIFIPAVA